MSTTPYALLASAARTASDVGNAYSNIPKNLKALIFFLDVTAAAHEAGDTLDVYIQDSPDEGTTWNDVVHFTQVLGNGGAKKYIAIVNCEIAPTTAQGAPQDAAMAAGARAGPICPYIRPKWVVAASGDVPADQSFTFGITMLAIR